MAFASINPTNPRTDLWNFCKKISRIDDFEKRPFRKISHFEFFFFFFEKKDLNLCQTWKKKHSQKLLIIGLICFRNFPPRDFSKMTLVIMLTLVNYTFLLMQLKMCSSTWVVDTYTWEMHKRRLLGKTLTTVHKGVKVFFTASFFQNWCNPSPD